MYRSIRLALVLGIAVSNVAPAGAQTQNAGQRKLAQACAADRKTYCGDVERGGGRIVACLQKNADKLTPECHGALDAARDARTQQRQGQ